MSVSAHIAEYQRIIMELRNEVSDLKQQLQARPETIKEDTPGNRSKQRTLDYVENLEKQHLQNVKNALLQAAAERQTLLQKLTYLSNQINSKPRCEAEAVSGDASVADGGNKIGSDAAAAPPGGGSALHEQLVTVRRQLQQNQQTVQEIMQTAVQRISSAERLQLLQLLVRGQFLEVLNEQQETELGLRRELLQGAMGQGALPPQLMHDAMAAEAWHTEHRPAMDFHAKMARCANHINQLLHIHPRPSTRARSI